MIELDNFPVGSDAEVSEVYQRCVLISGKCSSDAANKNDEGYVVVQTNDTANQTQFPEQRWPTCRGHFKALVLLSPGVNKIILTSEQDVSDRVELTIRYTPLLQTPPLHLAILIGKDSPLLIDCPPAKFGGVSSTHSSLDAAIAKFRMTAYMWQALSAEDLRAKGLGRRSFRLEEEWSTDTLTRHSVHTPTTAPVPKVHLIRTHRTTEQLRSAMYAQQNPNGSNKDALHSFFSTALLRHGAPFTREHRPVVAGLILDSHYDLTDTKLILGHAALGSHDPKGLSLGVFGSHLTYAWPRFMEEVPACLLDRTFAGETVGNDNGECDALWQACAVGQGAFLHEVGHAFGAEHTDGIMQRGYSPDWPRAFLGGVWGKEGGLEPVVAGEKHECRWDLSDALRFKGLREFWMPGDGAVGGEAPTVEVDGEGDDAEEVVLKCEAGIARVVLRPEGHEEVEDDKVSVATPVKMLRYSRKELETKYRAGTPIEMEVTAMNGKQCKVKNVWSLFNGRCYMQVPGTEIRLLMQSFGSLEMEDEWDDERYWEWAVMLKKRDAEGNLVDASKIDLRVGCGLDGAIVYYKDGTAIPCGPRSADGSDKHMGGHQSKKMALPKGMEISKVAVTRKYGGLCGLRMWLEDGKGRGALNYEPAETELKMLVPPRSHRIIGFFGISGKWGMCSKFGIVSAPRDAILPDSIYDLEELQNKPGPERHRNKKRRIAIEEVDRDEVMSTSSGGDQDTEGSNTSEDGDGPYDFCGDEEVDKVYQFQKS